MFFTTQPGLQFKLANCAITFVLVVVLHIRGIFLGLLCFINRYSSKKIPVKCQVDNACKNYSVFKLLDL